MDRGRDADGMADGGRDKESGPHKAKGEHSTLSSKSGGGDSVSIQKYHLPKPSTPLGQSHGVQNQVMGICVNPETEYLPLPRLASNDEPMREGLLVISGLSTH